VRIGKTVVRFEVKDVNGRWSLGLSLWLTKAMPEAVDLIGNFAVLRRRTNKGARRIRELPPEAERDFG
jgi:hypothetical protein